MRESIIRGLCLSVVLPTMLSACATDMRSFWAPRPAFLQGIPDDDSNYSQGVRDGCAQAMGSVGEGMPRIYGFAYDPNRGIEDREYYRGYVIGQNHCTYFINIEPI